MRDSALSDVCVVESLELEEPLIATDGEDSASGEGALRDRSVRSGGGNSSVGFSSAHRPELLMGAPGTPMPGTCRVHSDAKVALTFAIVWSASARSAKSFLSSGPGCRVSPLRLPFLRFHS